MSLPCLVPIPLKLWLLLTYDIRKDCRGLDVTILDKTLCAPVSKAQKRARGFGGEAVSNVWEEEAALAEYTLDADRRTCCCRRTNQMRVSSNEAITRLTWDSVIVEGHLKEAWIMATVIEPPPQKIVI